MNQTVAWELVPYDFTIAWVFDLDFGWLEFCRISEDTPFRKG